jgi:hypothetical protein
MNPKTFIGFAAVTVIAVAAAGISIGVRYADNAGPVDQERLFANLTMDQSEVGSISVQTATETLTAKNDVGNWSIVERSGYPGSGAKMEKVMLGLAEIRLSEPKTRLKERYPRLQVEDVAEKDANSKLLTVKGKEGEILAEVIVGRENRAVSGPGGTGIYVRKPGEEQAWLALGVLDVPDEPKDWINAKIIDVNRSRIQTGTVVQPNGDKLVIEKKQQVEKNFTLTNKPEGRKIQYESDVQNVGQGLEEFDVEDVRKAEDVTFPENKMVKTEYRTFDGLVVNVVTFEGETQEDGFWAKFVASVDDEAAKAATDQAKTPEPAASEARTEDEPKSEAVDVHKEAGRINATVSGWAFKIPAYKYRYMARRMDEVLEKEEEKGS